MSTGRLVYPLALALLLFAGSTAAAVSVSIDRNRVALGDSLRLTITATGGEELSDADLRPLLADFQILQRSTSSQMRFINGERSHSKQLLIDLAPKIMGNLQIPALRIGSALTNPLPVTVTAAPDAQTGGQAVLFEAEVDREQVYVQGQLILTLRVMQAVNLDGRSVSELEMDGAFVKPLEQKSFQRTIDGNTWLVHEVRYAIFPEHSGTLEIPSQVFTAREATGRRSFFDMGGGRRLRRVTQPLSVEVLPRPEQFTGDTWLPAQRITLTEEWSTPPESLRAGESATRTVRIEGEGLQGAQLPPVLFTPVDGLKFYPDQPEISEIEVGSGLMGRRRDSAAIVPTRSGEVVLPEIRIPWWDTQTDQLRWAVLPERRIAVAAAVPDATAPAQAVSAPTVAPATVPAAAGGHDALPWQALSAVLALGWLATLFYFFTRREPTVRDRRVVPRGPSEGEAWRALRKASGAGDGTAARQALIEWAQAATGRIDIASLQAVAAYFDDRDLDRALDDLDGALYGNAGGDWNGEALTACASRLRRTARRHNRDTGEHLELYPQEI